LFHTDSAPGIHPSEPSPLARCPGVSDRRPPQTVWLWSIPAAEAAGRPTERRPLGFCPYEDPLRTATCLAHRTPDAPLGFPLLGHPTADLVPTFAGTPLSHLLHATPYGDHAPVPQGLSVGGSPRPHLDTRPWTDATALLGFLHQFDSDHSDPMTPGLWVHLALRPASLPTANALSGFLESCRSCPETT
jgi:hypothetical protein